jgi:hypothetical protein
MDDFGVNQALGGKEATRPPYGLTIPLILKVGLF